MKVFGRRRRWHFPRGVMELFVFSQKRTHGVLELWGLSRRRRRPKLLIVLELLVSRRRRRRPMLLVALELLVSSRRRRLPTLHVVLELWALRVFRRRGQPSPRALLEL
jgi:hypothetical protein